MSVLLVAEINAGKLSPDTTAKAMSAARQLGDVTVLCASSEGRAAAEAASRIDGVAKVLLAESPAFAHGLAEPFAELIAAVAKHFEHVVAPSTATGKNVLPRVAALLDVMVISDVSRIVDGSTFERSIYAGNAVQTVRSTDSTKVLTVRTSAFPPGGEGGPAPIEVFAFTPAPAKSEWVEDQVGGSARPELPSARIVVAGGRALASGEGFKIIENLADQLGAAIGASRAAVDSGFAPSDFQVGQTGQVVAPDLYIAIGISGAIQHLAGMKESKVIVAINKDADAPIFGVADYGLVADLFEAIPQLQQALARRS